ncbi:hypothetical protein P8452_12756 [Trifolium repens]|nr:hypothetical protein P8452_12756 [Trifolium repens]
MLLRSDQRSESGNQAQRLDTNIAGTTVYLSWSAQYFGCMPQSLLGLAVLQLYVLRYLLPFVPRNGIPRVLRFLISSIFSSYLCLSTSSSPLVF